MKTFIFPLSGMRKEAEGGNGNTVVDPNAYNLRRAFEQLVMSPYASEQGTVSPHIAVIHPRNRLPYTSGARRAIPVAYPKSWSPETIKDVQNLQLKRLMLPAGKGGVIGPHGGYSGPAGTATHRAFQRAGALESDARRRNLSGKWEDTPDLYEKEPRTTTPAYRKAKSQLTGVVGGLPKYEPKSLSQIDWPALSQGILSSAQLSQVLGQLGKYRK